MIMTIGFRPTYKAIACQDVAAETMSCNQPVWLLCETPVDKQTTLHMPGAIVDGYAAAFYGSGELTQQHDN